MDKDVEAVQESVRFNLRKAVAAYYATQDSLIEQQNTPATGEAKATPIKMPPELKQFINNALVDKVPIVMAYTDENGRPILSFRGSLQAFSDDQLAMWVRNPDGLMMKSLKKNPHVALMYRNNDTKATYQLQGRARESRDEADRKKVYDASAQAERDHDFAHRGTAVIIDLDRVEGYAGLTPNGQVGKIFQKRDA